MKNQIYFPALVIKTGTIDKINYKFLVCDKRYLEVAFRDSLIVDSRAQCFDVEKVEQVGGINLFYSLKLVGKIVKVDPVLKKPVYKISIQDLKEELTKIIGKNPSRFSSLDSSNSLVDGIIKCSTVEQIFKIF